MIGKAFTESVVAIEAPVGVRRASAWRWGGVAALTLYGATAAPGLLWGDSGEAQLHVLLTGWYVDNEIARSHVLYYALARFAAWLAPMDAARVANLVSALFGALTVANAAWLCAALCRRRAAVVCGTLLLMVSHTLWQLSTSAEVLSLATALLTGELLAFVKLIESRRLRWLALVALLNGLGVSNHNLAMLMWPVYGVMAVRWWWAWGAVRWRAIAVAAGALAVGMLPVLALCVDDYLTHGNVRTTVESFLFGHYGSKVTNVSNVGALFGRAVAMTALSFPTPVIFLLFPGLVVLRRVVKAPIGWVIIGSTIAHGLFAVRYDVPDQHTFLLPTYVLFAMLAAVGMDAVFDRCRAKTVVIVVGLLSMVGPLVYATAPPVLKRFAPDLRAPKRNVPYRDRFTWFYHPWRCGYDGTERFARETLVSLPQGAWLVVDTTLSPPLNYLQVSESLRRDVRLESWGARQDWLEPVEEAKARSWKLRQGLLFVASDEADYQPPWLREGGYRFEPFGHVFRVMRED